MDEINSTFVSKQVASRFFEVAGQFLNNKIFTLWFPVLVILSFGALYYVPVFIYNVNIPNSDDFIIALNFMNEFKATSSLWDKVELLFKLHGEHRVFFPRFLVMMDYFLEGQVNFYTLVVVGNTALIGICMIFFKSMPELKYKLLFFSPVVLIVVEMQHWENTGFPTASIQNFFVVCFVLLALYSIGGKTKLNTVTGLGAFFMATFTSGSGILSFLPGAFILSIQKRFRILLVWLGVTVFLLTIYFYNYSSDNSSKGIDLILQNPAMIFKAFLACMGGFINFQKGWEEIGWGYNWSIAFGVAFLILFLYLTLTKYYLKSPVLFCFLLFFIITCAAMATSRSGLYSANELSTISRYKINSVCLAATAYLILLDILRNRIKVLWSILFIALAAAYNIFAYQKSFGVFMVHIDQLIGSGWAVVYKNDYSKLSDWNPELSGTMLRKAQENGIYSVPDMKDDYISLAPKSYQDADLSQEKVVPADSTVLYDFEVLVNSDESMLAIRRGWAVSIGHPTRQNVFVMKSTTTTYGFAMYIDYRSDITALIHKNNPSDKTGYDDCGFNVGIRFDRLEKGEYKTGVIIQTWDGTNLYIPSSDISVH